MTADNTDDLLARIDAVTASGEATPEQQRELDRARETLSIRQQMREFEQQMADSMMANLPGIDRVEFANPETGATQAVVERIPETDQAVVMRYDPTLGMVPDHLSEDDAAEWAAEQHRAQEDAPEQAQAATEQDETDPERALRDAIINDQMQSSEAQEGQASWQQELRRREHQRQIKEAALATAEQIRDYLGSYLVFPSALRDAQLDVLTVWAIHTYSFRASGVTPYIAVTAPTQGSGKTTVLELLSTLANNPSKVEVNPTAPVVRLMCDEGRTVFLDEIDTLASDKSFVAVMNSGYKAGGSITRIGRRKGDSFTETSSTFAPKAIAGIAREGSLPLPTATLDRCIEVKIVRAKPGELTKRFRVEVMRDEVEVAAMRDWMANWTGALRKELRDAYVELPALSSSRAEQIWEPLITIAHLLGGDWYRRLCAAAVLMDGGREQNVDPNAALVEDIATVVEAFRDMCPDYTTIKADDITSLRNVLVGRKLKDKLNTDQLTKRLGAFGIKAEVLKEDAEPTLVYNLTDSEGNLLPEWVDLFSRYGER